MKYIRQIVRLDDFENPWTSYIKNYIFKQNNSINAIIVGIPGTGKSWATLSEVAEIYPDFEFEGNWFFKASQFMKAAKDYYHQKKYIRGKPWILDEAGVDLLNLNYYDQINKSLNVFFQSARHRNYMFFATVPFMSLISKGIRKLMNVIWKAQGWNRDNKTIILPRILEYNDEYDKFYKKRLLVRTETGLTYCNRLHINKPPRKLRIEYEKRKKEFTTDLFEMEYQKMAYFEKKRQEKYFGKGLNDMQKKIVGLLEEKKSVYDIAELLGIRVARVYYNLKAMKDRGIDIIPIKDGRKVVSYDVINYREKAAIGMAIKREEREKKNKEIMERFK